MPRSNEKDPAARQVGGARNRQFMPGIVGERSDIPKARKQRRDIQYGLPVPIRWPKTRKEQEDALKTWHLAAAAVLHEGKHSFRLLGTIHLFINWKNGTLWPSNRTLAQFCGGCDVKTISRDIALYRKLGLLLVDEQHRQRPDRKRRGERDTLRILTPAFPEQLPTEFFLPDDDDLMDSVCPANSGTGTDDYRDSVCPTPQDSVCPPTLELTTEKRTKPEKSNEWEGGNETA